MSGLFRDIRVTSLRSLLAGSGLAIALVWVLAALWISQLRHVERVGAQRELSALATLLADHTDRTLQGVDLLLSLLVGKVEASLATPEGRDPVQLHAILRAGLAGIPQVRRALLVDASGGSIADSDYPVPRPVNSADRPHFQVHRDRDDVGLFISEPLRSRLNDEWAIILSRRVADGHGAFAGAITAVIDPTYFATLFRATLTTGDTQVSLVNRSGAILSTTGDHLPLMLGRRMQIEPLDLAARDLPPTGAIPAHASVDGSPRAGFYAVGRSYPVVVFVSRATAFIADASRRSETIIIVAGLFASASIVAIAWALSRRMRSLETRFRDGIECMSDGFMLWDAEERLVAWNSRADALMPEMVPFRVPGVHFDDYILSGAPVMFREEDADERARSAADRIARFRDAGAPWEFRANDGKIIEVDETRTASGGTVTIYRDITARRRQQEDLEKALVAEREANQVHRHFIAMASHEFRTPLAVIDGAAQRVLGLIGKSPEKIAERMARIRESVERMTRLMDRMLSSARLDEGRIELNMETVDLSALLFDAVGRQRQISAGFDIALRLPEERILIEGDPQLLEQVFANLLSNAVKYSGRSRLVEVAAAPHPGGLPRVVVTVTDHGIGVPAEEIGRLFTRFFRARTATGISGTGIGLHLTRELLHLHGGGVRVSSQLHRGSTFTVDLPVGAVATHRTRSAA